MVNLHVEPRVVAGWTEFCMDKPPYSIALDGYVSGPPRFDAYGPRANFNHHEGVDRLSTRATCGQVWAAVNQGLYETFKPDEMGVYVNDCDEDVCLSVWELQHPERVAGSLLSPIVRGLVAIEDLLDTTGGMISFDPRSRVMRKIAWVFKPYRDARLAGRLHQMGAEEMSGIIGEVGGRISRFVDSDVEEVDVDTRYERVGGGPGWALVKEQGQFARAGMARDGISAFVSLLGGGDGEYRYAMGRRSRFVPFPLERLYEALNSAESKGDGSPDAWGGSDTIGGCPRGRGSKLGPEEVQRIINEFLAQRKP